MANFIRYSVAPMTMDDYDLLACNGIRVVHLYDIRLNVIMEQESNYVLSRHYQEATILTAGDERFVHGGATHGRDKPGYAIGDLSVYELDTDSLTVGQNNLLIYAKRTPGRELHIRQAGPNRGLAYWRDMPTGVDHAR